MNPCLDSTAMKASVTQCLAPCLPYDVEREQATAATAGEFRHYDATEREGGVALLEEVAATGETRYKRVWLRGPILPAQGCLDHQLLSPLKGKIEPAHLQRQNELWRQHRI